MNVKKMYQDKVDQVLHPRKEMDRMYDVAMDQVERPQRPISPEKAMKMAMDKMYSDAMDYAGKSLRFQRKMARMKGKVEKIVESAATEATNFRDADVRTDTGSGYSGVRSAVSGFFDM